MKQTSPYEVAMRSIREYVVETAIVLLVASLAAIIWWLSSLQIDDASRCSRAGAVYLWREGKCVEGIREVHP